MRVNTLLLDKRSDSGDDGDTAYYTPNEGDRIVDCKTVVDSDPTNPNDPKLR